MDSTKQGFPQVLGTWGRGALQNLFFRGLESIQWGSIGDGGVSKKRENVLLLISAL